jgi:hypothetical protein
MGYPRLANGPNYVGNLGLLIYFLRIYLLCTIYYLNYFPPIILQTHPPTHLSTYLPPTFL